MIIPPYFSNSKKLFKNNVTYMYIKICVSLVNGNIKIFSVSGLSINQYKSNNSFCYWKIYQWLCFDIFILNVSICILQNNFTSIENI